jgi:hypothetical protein
MSEQITALKNDITNDITKLEAKIDRAVHTLTIRVAVMLAAGGIVLAAIKFWRANC